MSDPTLILVGYRHDGSGVALSQHFDRAEAEAELQRFRECLTDYREIRLEKLRREWRRPGPKCGECGRQRVYRAGKCWHCHHLQRKNDVVLR